MRRVPHVTLLLALAFATGMAGPDTPRTIVQLSEVKFATGTLYTSVVFEEGARVSARLLAADHDSMTATTLMTTDVETLVRLEQAIGELIAELRKQPAR